MALVFPGGDKHEVIIVALRLAVFGLMLHAEVTATALFSLVGVGNDQARQLEVVGQTVGFLQLGIHVGGFAGNEDMLVEFSLQLHNLLEGGG